MTITILVGTRPNLIKAAPLWHALQRYPGAQVNLIHTGQHRDAAMSAVFFQDLGLPEPSVMLTGDTSSPVRETAQIALELEPVLQAGRPDWVVVIGDVTSTLAGALAAKQLGLRVAHVEAGLRSGDRRMPEELNRIAVDHLSDLLFASEEAGVENLRREGIPPERIHFVGNVLIDALRAILPKAEKVDWQQRFFTAKTLFTAETPFTAETQRRGVFDIESPRLCASAVKSTSAVKNDYALCTFHRIANVDEPAELLRVLDLIRRTSRHLPVLFPAHPRTLQKIRQHQLNHYLSECPDVYVLPPVCYSEMVCLMQNARLVLTDSGGVQEETTWLGVSCFTFRETTERPSTVQYGTNTIISNLSPETAERQIELLLAGNLKRGTVPPLWDGHAAERIAAILCS